MIISRTPFRVSFSGGGTDIRDFYVRNGYGAVISAAIQKYMYIIIHPYFHDKIRIKYSKTEDVEHIEEIKHPIVKECLKRVGVSQGVEIASFADISSGTGLGSSSSFTVGLLNALYAYKGKVVSKQRLAEEACEIEIDILKEPIGKQDQFAAAYGNVNHIRFNMDETVEVTPILLPESTKNMFEKTLCLYYTGGQRNASDILNEQRRNLADDNEKYACLKKMLRLVDDFNNSLFSKELYSIGKVLHKGWMLKRNLTGSITNEAIDNLYEKARNYGAEGGKILGAGGAGFLLIFHKNHDALAEQMNCRTLPFKIDREGTKIIFFE